MANEYVTQANYGGSAGWEDLTIDETLPEAEQFLADHEAHEPRIAHRIVMRRTGWEITFSDREGCIVYLESIARRVVRKEQDPQVFVPGNVTRVEKVVTEWFGADTARGFVELSRVDVDFGPWKTDNDRPKLTKIATGQFGGLYVASSVARQLGLGDGPAERNKCPECGIQLRADGSPDVLPGESGHYAGCTR